MQYTDGDVTAAALAAALWLALPVVELEFELVECCHRASVRVNTCTYAIRNVRR